MRVFNTIPAMTTADYCTISHIVSSPRPRQLSTINSPVHATNLQVVLAQPNTPLPTATQHQDIFSTATTILPPALVKSATVAPLPPLNVPEPG